MSAPATEITSPLQRRLARDIAAHLRAEGLEAGSPVNQLALAARFGVSRTPIRAALQALSDVGVVRFAARGVEVADAQAEVPLESDEPDALEALIATLARDRHGGALQSEVKEADLMRRYGVSRPDIVAALRRLAELGLAARKPGFGWRFLASAETAEEKQAAYRFRLAVEPAALLEPSYRADPAWLAAMRRDHERFRARAWRPDNAVAFFEMNAAFHLGLVGFSRNRFFIQATEQQNSLRRLRNYSWRLGEERVRISCDDHLAIIATIEAGDMRAAANALTRHLEQTALLVGATADADPA